MHELQGLILLCARAAGDAGHPVPLLRPGGAVKAFGEAIKRADDKEAVRARGQRMLSWFGQDPAPLAPKPKTPTK